MSQWVEILRCFSAYPPLCYFVLLFIAKLKFTPITVKYCYRCS